MAASTPSSGTGAGINNTIGNSNTFVGGSAGNANTSGGHNAFLGTQAGKSNTTGAFNAFFGRNAGFSNTTGSDNAFFGPDVGYSNSTGGLNSFFGIGRVQQHHRRPQRHHRPCAGAANTTQNDNTAIGSRSDTTAGITRATALGQRAKVGQSDSLVLGAISGINGATNDTQVGIGTTAPSAPLEVESDNPTGPAGNELLRLEQTNTARPRTGR